MSKNEHTVGPEFFDPMNFNPLKLCTELEKHGFVFESRGCPTIFAGKLIQTANPDGSVTFIQRLDEETN